MRTFSRDMSGFSTAVAGLSGGVKRAPVRGCAIFRDVAEFAAGVAFHGLGLAIAGEVVRSAAFVAGRCAVSNSEAASESAESTTRTAGTTTSTRSRGGSWSCAGSRAVALKD